MNESKAKPSRRRRPFPLWAFGIVTILIFSGLAMSVASWPPHRTSKKVKAQAAIRSLSDAIDLFYDKYESLPGSSEKNEGSECKSGNKLMEILCGLEQASHSNPYQISFFEFKRAREISDDYYDGLHRTPVTVSLYGPWKNKDIEDRYYRIILDHDGNKTIREPAELGGNLIPNVRYLIYHKGKDGKIGGDYNDDNIYSWK